MAELAIAAMVAGTVLSAGGAYAEGVQADKQAKYEANQMAVNAGQERAMAQRRSIESRRQGRLAESRLQAVAAASGAGAVDPTTVRLAQDISAEGEYNALSDLYTGEEQARQLEGAAGLRRYEGKMARKAGTLKAISTVLSSAGSMYGKYGGGGPKTDTVSSKPPQGYKSAETYRDGTTIYWR